MLVTPLLVTVVLAIPTLIGRSDAFHLAAVPPGIGFGTLAVAFALIAIGPVAFNQFAADGPGLTLQVLAPIADRDLVVGKAVGLGLTVVAAATLALALLFVLFPAAPPGLWVALLLAGVASVLALGPIWALLSAVFPRAVNLNSIGKDGNPHGLANLLGALALAASLAPSAALALFASFWLERPDMAALLVAVWVLAAGLIGRLLVRPAVAAWRARRENIALTIQRQ